MIDYMAVSRPQDLVDLSLENQLDAAKTHFVGYKKQIEDMRQQVGTFKVDSQQAALDLTKITTNAAMLIKTLEKQRKQFVAEPGNFVRQLNSFVKTYRDILQDIVDTAKGKISTYQYEQELSRRKAEKKAQEQQAKLQAKMDAEAAAAGIEAPQMPAVVLPQKSEPIRTDSGTASLQTYFDYDLADITQVPEGYLMVNDKAVKAAIKAGIRKIPGLVIKEVPRTVIRTVT